MQTSGCPSLRRLKNDLLYRDRTSGIRAETGVNTQSSLQWSFDVPVLPQVRLMN